ncbi:THO complex 1-like protein Hpr1 isoform X2 [Lycorma delicatula]|uniref:THO complex 1-like protein Hpr1 isoform X2 n=1 Tax=Lycorma delicatula TaxID=130591 RepID=UPI003F5167A6
MDAVKVSLAKGNVESLKKIFDSLSALEVDKRSVLDQVLRDHLLVLLSEGPQNTSTWECYLTLCIDACRKDLVTTTMPVVLLGDIFDASTLDKCEKLFTFVENNVQLWKEDMFVGACKNNLLRMCNDLLRRLSRSQNTVFCGRILLFLAKFFPFSERSGLNIVSEFNLENVTEFSTDEPMETKDGGEDKFEEEKSTDRIKVDYNLYTKFWALQDFFRNPNQCYNKMQWKVFSSHSACVLSAFKSFKLDDECKLSSKKSKIDEVEDGNVLTQHYFAKYLTNQKLLDLQLSDVNFRRYVLLQFLILFQYLNSHVKFKSETYELKPEQSEWVSETTQQVYKLLEETPPDGVKFAETVKNILQREEYWNNWKNEGCHVRRPTAPPDDIEDDITNSTNNTGAVMLDGKKRGINQRFNKRPRKKLAQIMKEAAVQKKYVLGNPELTKLWNHLPDNLEACRAKERDFLPSLETYFEEAIEQSDPAAMVDAEYKRVNDSNFGWRALRLLARRSPHFFTHSNNPINKLPDFLEIMIKKIAKDKPLSVTGNEIKSEQTESKEGGEEIQAMIVNEPDGEDDDLLKAAEERRDDARVKEDNTAMKLLKSLMNELSELISADGWKKLGVKLGYQQSEIDYFEGITLGRKSTAASSGDSNTNLSPVKESVKQMLLHWCDNDDANIENLIYTLEGLNMNKAVYFLKQYQPTVID